MLQDLNFKYIDLHISSGCQQQPSQDVLIVSVVAASTSSVALLFHSFITVVPVSYCVCVCVCSNPGLELGGELGLELAHGAVGVVPLDEDLGGDGRLLLPHVLQAVSLERGGRGGMQINKYI